jgi:hypothetical protein
LNRNAGNLVSSLEDSKSKHFKGLGQQ